MDITVEYFAQLKEAAGVPGETVSVGAESAVADLLIRVADRRDAAFRSMVLSRDGRPNESLIVSVNGEQVSVRDRRGLRAGDVVVLFSPMSGG